jgi:pimeloyl-ACP methyl ester carboxylesterase
MLVVAAAGYRTVVPLWHGYGLSDQSSEDEEVSYDDLFDDILGILDALSIAKVSVNFQNLCITDSRRVPDPFRHTRSRES